MKKRVFDLPTYVEWLVNESSIDTKRQLRTYDWMYKLHGKSKDETSLIIDNKWTKEIDVPKFNVGDKVKLIKTNMTEEKYGYIDFAMLSIGDVGIIKGIDGCSVTLSDILSYHEEDLELYIEPPIRELTMKELNDLLGYEVKIKK